MCAMLHSGAHLKTCMFGKDSGDEVEPVSADACREPHRHALLALHRRTYRYQHRHTPLEYMPDWALQTLGF